MKRIKTTRLLPVLIVFFLFAINLFSANNHSGIKKGKVLSNDGIALYNAHIALPSLNRGTVSNEKGEFIIKNIPNGIPPILKPWAMT